MGEVDRAVIQDLVDLSDPSGELRRGPAHSGGFLAFSRKNAAKAFSCSTSLASSFSRSLKNAFSSDGSSGSSPSRYPTDTPSAPARLESVLNDGWRSSASIWEIAGGV